MTETKSQADKVKEEEFNKCEKMAATCDIVISQINKLTTDLETLKEKGDTERLFVSMKHAESQIESLEENLEKIDKENTVREYQFEPDARLTALFNELKELGQLLYKSDQQNKRPIHIKNIIAKSSLDNNFTIEDSLVLPNEQILITDWDNMKLKLIDTNKDNIISELKLSGFPVSIAKVKDNEVAVTIHSSSSNKIQFVTVCQNVLSIGQKISVNGDCRGIVYNDKDQTLIVAYCSECKVEILNMTGTVVKRLYKGYDGHRLFQKPRHVALSPTMTDIYVTDCGKQSVIRLTMNGNVINTVDNILTVYDPEGICVRRSGLMYVVDNSSHTVHQIDINSGESKLLLEKKDGLYKPWSISYCELEDKLYIGMSGDSSLKVFQMK